MVLKDSSEHTMKVAQATAGMRKSSSEPSAQAAGMRKWGSESNVKSAQAAGMRKSSSEPNVKSAQATTGLEPALPRTLRGGVLLKDAPGAEKTMRVDFEASPGTLRIVLRQERDGVAHDFVLCTLDLTTLFVGFDTQNQDMFVLAARHQDRVFHPIYCYPCRFRMDRWLRFFEDNGCAGTSMVRTSACENAGFRVLSRIAESSSSLERRI